MMPIIRLADALEDDLWRQRSSSRVRDELICRYLPFSRRLASRYRNPHEAQEDLAQVAGLALVRAVDRFDPDRGVSFVSYATPTILGELKKHFRDTAWALHVPRSLGERAQVVQQTANALSERLGRSPTIMQISAELDMSLEATMEALDAAAARYADSLDAPVKRDNPDLGSLVDTIGDDDDAFDLVDTRLTLAQGVRELPLQQRQALQLRMGRDLTQAEIARHLGCSQMHVSRLLRRAARQLQQCLAGATPA